ncbi:SDR family NAD(P)-dependent oxidoreductase [Streptomyces sp. CS131]|uniref:SDR family NAD(P)-dependent oxidoreductase n=1 Tax=Streptomyces sp. CS131 TaxID=2162711 RepID=UPI00194F3ACB|nr:SDR family NAD(P)-dependent oxidoreductase [Streptomyces sp. CS131]
MSEQTIALVTGANKGIGYEIAAGLGALGWSVGIGARDRERGAQATAALCARGVDAFAVPLDVTDDADVSAAARLMEKRAGRLDVLANNACPGYVATDLNGFSGTRTAEEGARVAIRLATLPDDEPTGGLFDDEGPVPW